MEQIKGFCRKAADYDIVKLLGKGAYGSAYKVRHKSDLRELVMKVIRLRELSVMPSSSQTKNQRAAYREVSIMKSIEHPHIIRYETSFADEDSLYIVMEYAQKGDLQNVPIR